MTTALQTLLATPPATTDGVPIVGTLRWYVRMHGPPTGAYIGNFIIGRDKIAGPTWFDCTASAHGLEGVRGGQPSNQYGAGQLTFSLDNETESFSPYRSPRCGPGTLIQCGFITPTEWLPMFTGLSTSWVDRVQGVGARKWVDVTALELVSIAGDAKVAASVSAGAGDTLPARVDRVLTNANWQYGSRVNVSAPASTWGLQATTLADDAWTELQKTAKSMTAMVKSGKDGVLEVVDRDLGNLPGLSTIGRDVEPVADSIITDNNDRLLISSVIAGRVGGTAVTYPGRLSSRFGLRSDTFTDMITQGPGADVDLLRYASDVLDRGSQTYRPTSFSLDSEHGERVLQFIARMDLGTRVDIRRPAGRPSDQSGVLFSNYLVCGYSFTAQPKADMSGGFFKATVSTEPSRGATWKRYTTTLIDDVARLRPVPPGTRSPAALLRRRRRS